MSTINRTEQSLLILQLPERKTRLPRAAMVLAHLVGLEPKQNSLIISSAYLGDQASLVFKLAEKMIRLSPELSKIEWIVSRQKMLIGLVCKVE